MSTKLIVCEREELERQATKLLTLALQNVLKQKKRAVLAVPGGRSVSGIFDLLGKEKLPWEKIHIFQIDERLVPCKSNELNFIIEEKHLLKNVCANLVECKVHPLECDVKSDVAIAEYATKLKSLGGKFDVILLSVGEDGHVGALYPHHHSIKNGEELFISMDDSPKPPAHRMTASKRLLSKAQVGLVLAFGPEKKEALKKILDKNLSIEDCPAKIIHSLQKGYVLTDQEVENE